MKAAVLKGVCLIAMVGCEAEAPSASKSARSQMGDAALRAEKVLEDSGDAAEAPTCRRGERVIYACDFGPRRVAVCANDNRLSYRFGDARRTDLEIDSRPGHVRAHVGGVVGGGGSQNHIRFSNNGYQYVVHSMVAGSLTDTPGRRGSGVSVIHGKDADAPVVRTLTCPRVGDAQSLPPQETLPAGTFAPAPEAWNAWY